MDPQQMQELLSQLRDAHSPEAVGWWPPAPGWWLLLIILIAGLVALGALLRHRQRLNLYRKEGLALLDQAYQQMRSNQEAVPFLNQCAQLLRRVLLYRQGRTQVAQLSGAQWRTMLENASGPRLSDASLNAMVVQQYRPQPEFDAELLYRDLRDYISKLEPAGRV